MPDTALARAATEPTDRSMWPPMMTITMPMASTRMYEYWSTTLVRFSGLSSVPSVKNVNRATIATNAMKIPLWRRLRRKQILEVGRAGHD